MSNRPTIYINNVWSTIEGLPHNGYARLYDKLSYDIPGAQFVVQKAERATTDEEVRKYAKYANWDGKKHLVKKARGKDDSGTFLTGLLSQVYLTLVEEFGVLPHLVDRRKKPDKKLELEWNPKFKPRNYQLDIVKESLKKGRGLIEVCTGGGKCANKNTLCLTEEGMLPLWYFDKKGLKEEQFHEVNINVYDGRKNNEASKIYFDGKKSSVKVTTKSGFEIIGTFNHKIKILNTQNGCLEWISLSEINKKNIIPIHKGHFVFGPSSKISEETAYILGILYGDGYIKRKDRVCFTNEDNHIINKFLFYLNKNNFKYRILNKKNKTKEIICRKDFRDYLFNNFGVGYEGSCDKKWPLDILKSKKEIVSKFIRGLYETDGWVEEKPSICISLSNEEFIKTLQIVLLNFGILSHRTSKKTKKQTSHKLAIYGKNVLKFLKEIGLDEVGHKYKKIKKILDSKDIIYNTNTEVFPCDNSFFINLFDKIKKDHKEKFMKSGIRYTDKYVKNDTFFFEKTGIKQNTANSYCRNKNKHPEISSLKKIFNYLNIDDQILDGSFYFDKIKKIEIVESENYDFEIPNTHTFIGNGFVNHNTLIVSKLIQELGVSPFIFYVLTKDLMYQAKERLEEYMPGLDVGIIGDGACEIKEINVMTIQTAYRCYEKPKKDDEKENFIDLEEGDIKAIKSENLDHLKRKQDIKKLIESAKGVYFDEAHHAAAATCQKIMGHSSNAYYIYGGTATPERADNADLMIEGIFGRKIGSITASFLIEKGFLIQPNITYINLKTKRVRVKNYAEDYKKHIIENDERNKYIIDIARHMETKGIPTLILVQRINHGELLENLIPNSVFIQGKSKNRQEVIEDMRTGRRNIMIATTLADEGLDISRLTCLIMAGGGKSPIKCKQRVGRVIRTCDEEDKNAAWVYDFNDIGRWLPSHSTARKKILEQEPKFNVKNVDKVEFIKKKNIF